MSDPLGEPRQTLHNLRGEIDFRAKLAVQHVSGDLLLPDYYGKEEHDRILQARVDATRTKMTELAGLGITLSPFLELGAERGQRSLVLTNDFGATGIAIDISYHQLRTMEHFAQLFNRPKLPLRICCDANHLPFKSNSFPFVFCYEFLHHFPSLASITREIHRVTADGYFYFDEEPFRRVLKLALYRQRSKIYSEKTLRKHRYVSLIESFVSEAPCDEVEHGIVENHDLPLTEWLTALSLFDRCDIDLISLERFRSKLSRRLRLRNLANVLLGGIIAGLCQKTGRPASERSVELRDLLGCPHCKTTAGNGAFDRPSLIEVDGGYRCPRCGFKYPAREGVVFLLPPSELQELYPAS
jgi:SAM-dependent methyltransferase/DNA-directed RNA polymerase subunit RPC12/RpoP